MELRSPSKVVLLTWVDVCRNEESVTNFNTDSGSSVGVQSAVMFATDVSSDKDDNASISFSHRATGEGQVAKGIEVVRRGTPLSFIATNFLQQNPAQAALGI